VINTTDEKVLLESDEPAFMVLGSASFEEPGHAPNVKKRTTVFTIRGNAAFRRKMKEVRNAFINAPMGEATKIAYAVLKDLEDEVCRRVCSDRAEFTAIHQDIYAVVWTRDVLKGGKKR
jgi:hypothetical protein